RFPKPGAGLGRAALLAGPLALNLAWAALALLVAPLALGGWTKAAHQLPDVTWILAGSGALALGWALVRTAWAWRVTRR
ncbi:MAG TPA: hypothetical protein VGE07_07455, partial [Herpetosiphonaceae bacterium]